MATSKELRGQIEALQKQLVDARKHETGEAVEKVRALIREHGLTMDDIGKRVFAHGSGSPGKATGGGQKTVNPAKYRDPKSGKTWTGKGRAPAWMAGALKGGREAEFLIAGAAAPGGTKASPAKKAARKKAPTAAKKARKST